MVSSAKFVYGNNQQSVVLSGIAAHNGGIGVASRPVGGKDFALQCVF
jgi:hypothetical protein